MKTNLQSGKGRPVFVADVIPPELKRVAEFLDGQMHPVEVRQFVGKGLKPLVEVGLTEYGPVAPAPGAQPAHLASRPDVPHPPAARLRALAACARVRSGESFHSAGTDLLDIL